MPDDVDDDENRTTLANRQNKMNIEFINFFLSHELSIHYANLAINSAETKLYSLFAYTCVLYYIRTQWKKKK